MSSYLDTESLSVSRVLWTTVAEVSLRLWSRGAQVPKGISRIPNAVSIKHQQPGGKGQRDRDLTTKESKDQTETTAKTPGAEGHCELRKLVIYWGLRGREGLCRFWPGSALMPCEKTDRGLSPHSELEEV